MLAKQEAIEQVGLMDERFFMYGEETDWCYRFKQAGWKIVFTPHAQIIHIGGQSTIQKSAAMAIQLRLSILKYIRKHYGWLMYGIARFLTALFFFLRVPYWASIALLGSNERKKSIETARTYLVGGFYCLTDWQKLLMNKGAIKSGL